MQSIKLQKGGGYHTRPRMSSGFPGQPTTPSILFKLSIFLLVSWPHTDQKCLLLLQKYNKMYWSYSNFPVALKQNSPLYYVPLPSNYILMPAGQPIYKKWRNDNIRDRNPSVLPWSADFSRTWTELPIISQACRLHLSIITIIKKNSMILYRFSSQQNRLLLQWYPMHLVLPWPTDHHLHSPNELSIIPPADLFPCSSFPSSDQHTTPFHQFIFLLHHLPAGHNSTTNIKFSTMRYKIRHSDSVTIPKSADYSPSLNKPSYYLPRQLAIRFPK